MTSPREAPPAAPEQTALSVSATGLGSWPGTDPTEAARTIRGELGEPNLPHLVELPDRGVGSDPVGRTAAMLLELAVDLQPHGWRLVDRPGLDHRRAASALSTDVNVLADVAGAEEDPGSQLKLQCRGPLSMAANLYLHNGERALLDSGARRDIAESLAAGVVEHLQRVRRGVPGADIIVQVEEPEIAQVLAGAIPTASGYRTLRAVPEHEVSTQWRQLVESLHAAGARQVVVALPGADAPFDLVLDGGMDGVAVALEGLTTVQWEALAAAAEADKGIWLGAVQSGRPVQEPPRVTAIVDSVLRPWRQLGLPLSRLPQLRLTPSTGLAGQSPEAARRILTRLSQSAEALNQIVAEG